VKQRIATALLPLSFVAIMAGAQSTAEKAPSQAMQTHDYWTDPTTNLMWTTKDNGKDISWKNATKYCRKLSLAGYTAWRMPNMDELVSIYDKNANSPGLMGAQMYHNVAPATWHVKGNIFLTGDQWSTLQRLDDRRKPSGYVYYVDFNEGKENNDPTGWPYGYVGMRVLCVRGPEASPNHTTNDFQIIKIEK
jgi:hypothetical protein